MVCSSYRVLDLTKVNSQVLARCRQVIKSLIVHDATTFIAKTWSVVAQKIERQELMKLRQG